jgi:membrane protein
VFAYFRAPGGIFRIIKRTVEGTLDDDCFGLAAELAYYFFLALFPALIFGVSLLGFLPVRGAIPAMLSRLSTVAPHDVVNIVGAQLQQLISRPNTSLLTLGIIGALWSSSSAVSAIIDTLNRVYEIKESRSWWRVRLRAIILTIGLILFFLLAMVLVLIGPVVANWLDSSLHLGAIVITLWNVVRWIGAFFLTVLGIDIVYSFGPDAETRWVWITPGSLLATILWIAGSVGFRFYIAYFGTYNATYGAIGGIIVLMLWFYISGLSILIGAELDASIDQAVVEKRKITLQQGARRRIGAALESYQ